MGLEGKVALVTGAGRGQGRAMAVRLAEAGADVACLDIDGTVETAPYPLAGVEDLTETAQLVEKTGRRALALAADVRSQAELDEAVAQTLTDFGGLDVVVANAGIWALGAFWELTETQWTQMQDVVLGGVWRTVKAATPHLISQQSGSVVLTSSVNGLEGGPGFAHYTAAKHGVIGFMRAAAQELGPHNVRVNAICPGFMDTQMNQWPGAYDMMAGHPGGTAQDRADGAYHWSLLQGRGALPVEATADAVLWLAGDLSRHVTGVALPVDGGHLVLPGLNTAPVRP
ncbi:NAD(P)-dependent oxidoreductase [Nocardioides mangrovicus]|uniref:NAD(P)-dependent oxidoreductase n=1 Tax=Nocardioides mangrovicus TaxID=2478913 RepID=A0A3L8NYW8_9ACTN|nr:NAD(P)-dependent oxidoreductase [Nocardioides mangrovicus]